MASSEASPNIAESSATQSTTNAKNFRSHACVLCQQRKVRCDRNDPCSGCVKARVDCIFRAPAPPRRRKRKDPEVDVHARLKHYETLLRGYAAKIEHLENAAAQGDRTRSESSASLPHRGISVASSSASPGGESGTPWSETGRLSLQDQPGKILDSWVPAPMFRHNVSIADDDRNLWMGLHDEFKDPRTIHNTLGSDDHDDSSSGGSYSDASDLVMGFKDSVGSLTHLHPQPVQIFRLWQVFLDNVNPLSKCLHGPSVQREILEASASLDTVSTQLEALMFSIYTLSIASLSSEEVESIMQEPRSVLLSRYTAATKQALIKTDFLRSYNMTVLQALLFYLLSLRLHYDPHALWILCGTAVRLSQKLGLHRDGSSLGLSVFESEIRRRVWWQIVMLDTRSAQVSGSADSVDATLWDTQIPSNLNDGDLSPEMKELPIQHTGATEMIFCLMRYEFGRYLRNSGTSSPKTTPWRILSNPNISIAEKDKTIDDLENLLHNKYLKFTDPSMTLHTLCHGFVVSALGKMRLIAHHPRQWPNDGSDMPQHEKDYVLSTSSRILEFDCMGHATKVLHKFFWHINVYFQLDAFVFLLSELSRRDSGPLVDDAWNVVFSIYKYHPELMNDRKKNRLFVAVGRLTLRAWKVREAGLKRQMDVPPETPDFITSLRKFEHPEDSLPSTTNLHPPLTSPEVDLIGADHIQYVQAPSQINNTVAGVNPQLSYENYRVDAMDWNYWNDLITDYEMQPLDWNDRYDLT